jgi:hypothetical protein
VSWAVAAARNRTHLLSDVLSEKLFWENSIAKFWIKFSAFFYFINLHFDLKIRYPLFLLNSTFRRFKTGIKNIFPDSWRYPRVIPA